MKTRILFVSLALMCVGFTLPTRRVLSRPASSGGGGPSGAPVYAASVTNRAATVSSATLTGLPVSGANKLLMVAIIKYGSGISISQIQWNGAQNLTQHSTSTYFDAGGSVEIWRLIAPTDATANIVITFSGTVDSYAACALLYTNVNQTTPLGSIDSATRLGGAPGTSLTVNPASTITSDKVFDMWGYYEDSTYTVGAGQTPRASSDGVSIESIDTSDKAAASGTTSMQRTWAGNKEGTLVGVAIKGG